MTRWTGFGIGAAALLAAWLAADPPAVRAGGGRRVEIFGMFGRARLGVVLKDIESGDVARLKLPEERGALVKQVEPESPAQKAGLKAGDVILRYQGEAVQSAAQLSRMVRETPPGRKVTLEVSRDGSAQKLQATLEERKGDMLLSDDEDLHFDVPIPPVPPVPPIPQLEELQRFGRGHGFHDLFRDRGPRKLGIEYMEISDQLARYFRVPGDEGILVSSVDEDGPAGHAGMKAGDVILKVGGKAVHDGEGLREEVARLAPGQEVTVTIQRDGAARDLKLKIGGKAEQGREGDST